MKELIGFKGGPVLRVFKIIFGGERLKAKVTDRSPAMPGAEAKGLQTRQACIDPRANPRLKRKSSLPLLNSQIVQVRVHDG
jgi:hypothetical protein